MKKVPLFLLLLLSLQLHAQTNELTKALPDGRLTLSEKGVSYFATLSLNCANRIYPHYYYENLQKPEDLQPPEKLWPSFYGCNDWHSGVHNHWALVKLLKAYPAMKEAAAVKEKLEKSFNADNILQEVKYLSTHQEEDFEFPYATSWLLKVADELANWNDPLAKKWLKNLAPLTSYIVQKYMKAWPKIEEPSFSGNHYNSAMGLSFALDYARSVKNDSLASLMVKTANRFYANVRDFPFEKEPFGFDFMSAGLLVADLMRKVLPADEYVVWLKKFSPDLFTISGLTRVFAIKKATVHDGMSAHWDGFHLNRIWCLNGILKSLPPGTLTADIRSTWIESENEMWEYAQTSIGKGNYDIDHWLSSFSVFALEGYR